MEHYRLNSATIFWHDIYTRRMNIESVIFVKKDLVVETIVEVHHFKNKETKLKNVLYNIYRALQLF